MYSTYYDDSLGENSIKSLSLQIAWNQRRGLNEHRRNDGDVYGWNLFRKATGNQCFFDTIT